MNKKLFLLVCAFSFIGLLEAKEKLYGFKCSPGGFNLAAFKADSAIVDAGVVSFPPLKTVARHVWTIRHAFAYDNTKISTKKLKELVERYRGHIAPAPKTLVAEVKEDIEEIF